MIHSMAGGKISNVTYNDFAKVKITSGPYAGDVYFFLSIPGIKVGDIVKVPLGKTNNLYDAQVLRIDKNVSSQMAPINPKYAKRLQTKL